MNAKDVVEKLVEGWNSHWAECARREFKTGDYEVRNGPCPDEYDEQYSEICWGWLKTGPQTDPIVATFGHGERGNESYDESNEHLVIYYQVEAGFKNARIEQAAKALLNKKIGFGEFKRIVRENS